MTIPNRQVRFRIYTALILLGILLYLTACEQARRAAQSTLTLEPLLVNATPRSVVVRNLWHGNAHLAHPLAERYCQARGGLHAQAVRYGSGAILFHCVR